MLWLSNRIQNIISDVNPNDIAFLLASSLEINKQKRSRAKAQVALDCLNSHKSFKHYVFEFYLKERSGKIRCVALSGVSRDLMDLYSGRAVMPSSKIFEVFNSKKMLFHTSLVSEAGRRGEFINRASIKTSLLLPIEDFGVLVVDRIDNLKFTKYEITLLKHFVYEIVQSSLELALDNEKNFNAAIRDSLTGLYNHGYFMLQLERELDNAKRGNYQISLIMVDIDYFKHYNDLNGHPKGDQVLIGVANVLKHNTRKGDVAVRYGGEEFVVILYNAKLKFAVEKAEALRKAVSNYRFYKEEMQPNRDLTISLGVASFPANASNTSELIDKADKALYHSKNTGKNKVSVYGKDMK